MLVDFPLQPDAYAVLLTSIGTQEEIRMNYFASITDSGSSVRRISVTELSLAETSCTHHAY
jgi:hypothetical protein